MKHVKIYNFEKSAMQKELACDMEIEIANIFKTKNINSVEMDSKVHCSILITKSNYRTNFITLKRISTTRERRLQF